jgi:hypothetical protein
MLYIRRSLSAFAFAGALALPLRAQSLAALCRAALRVAPGQWSSYRFIGGNNDGGMMRLAIVGTQRVGDSTFYWYEMKTVPAGKTEQDANIVQVLVAGLGTAKLEIHDLVLKTPGHSAQRYNQLLVSMMAGPIAQSIASETGRRCANPQVQVVGWESLTVPAGTMRALHLKDAESGGGDAWFVPHVPFGVARVLTQDGHDMVLTGSGHDAKSSITETPPEMGP